MRFGIRKYHSIFNMNDSLGVLSHTVLVSDKYNGATVIFVQLLESSKYYVSGF